MGGFTQKKQPLLFSKVQSNLRNVGKHELNISIWVHQKFMSGAHFYQLNLAILLEPNYLITVSKLELNISIWMYKKIMSGAHFYQLNLAILLEPNYLITVSKHELNISIWMRKKLLKHEFSLVNDHVK